MSESEKIVRVFLTAEMPLSDFDELITRLGSRMLEGARFGQGSFDFMLNMEREALKEVVTLQAARNFYLHLYQDDRPSPLASVVMQEIARHLSPDNIIKNGKGEFNGIQRPAWDTEVAKIFSGESRITYRPGTKKRTFLEALNTYLPPVDPPQKKQKKKSAK